MFKKMRKIAAVSAVCCSVSLCCAAGMNVCAAETGTAYVFLRDVAENGVRYEGTDSAVNTVKDGVSTQTIEKDGSYTVQIDLSKESSYETVDEISMLKLYVTGTENTKDVEITVDDLKINGDSVSLSGTPTAKTSGNDYYFDLCDTNGDELFNRTDYVNTIKTIAIDFTVKGWPEVSADSNSGNTSSDGNDASSTATTAPEETTTAATSTTTTAAPTNTAVIDSPSNTGDSSTPVMAAAAAAAVLSVLSVRKKK